MLPKRRKARLHRGQPEKHQSETEKYIPGVGPSAPAQEKLEGDTDRYGRQRVLLDIKGDQLRRHGRPDVGAQDDTDGLAEGQQAGIHKTYQHDRSGGRALNDRGNKGSDPETDETVA